MTASTSRPPKRASAEPARVDWAQIVHHNGEHSSRHGGEPCPAIGGWRGS